MNIVDRVKNIVLTPKTEWPVIAAEATSVRELYLGYVVLLAAIGPVARFIGLCLFGFSFLFAGGFGVPIVWALSGAIAQYVLALVGVFIVGLIIDALAPTFGGEKNRLQALKVAVYASTPSWVAGVFYLLPALGILAVLASLYGIYVLYLGLPVLMKAPQEKAVPYTAVVIVCAIVVFVVIGLIAGMVGGFGMPARGFGYRP
jgi:Yip1-like protein